MQPRHLKRQVLGAAGQQDSVRGAAHVLQLGLCPGVGLGEAESRAVPGLPEALSTRGGLVPKRPQPGRDVTTLKGRNDVLAIAVLSPLTWQSSWERGQDKLGERSRGTWAAWGHWLGEGTGHCKGAGQEGTGLGLTYPFPSLA